jgi:hypothetical protein
MLSSAYRRVRHAPAHRPPRLWELLSAAPGLWRRLPVPARMGLALAMLAAGVGMIFFFARHRELFDTRRGGTPVLLGAALIMIAVPLFAVALVDALHGRRSPRDVSPEEQAPRRSRAPRQRRRPE